MVSRGGDDVGAELRGSHAGRLDRSPARSDQWRRSIQRTRLPQGFIAAHLIRDDLQPLIS